MVDFQRLQAAYEAARKNLVDARGPHGHWVGHLDSSPLATATAISALLVAEQYGRQEQDETRGTQLYQGDLSTLIVRSLHWLAKQQNDDGGWGDTTQSLSNIATTILVQSAFRLAGVPAKYADLLDRAEKYVRTQGNVPGLRRRYGKDKTFAVPILANSALAGIVPWREVPPLPFELACVPQSFYRWLGLPVVSYAIPALVAIGQATYYHRKPFNPLVRALRSAAIQPSLKLLEKMQPESGGFLEATPLTSFVVMSLSCTGRGDHLVTQRGVEFLLTSVRPDGSWPIDTNLAIWNTTLSLQALAAVGSGNSICEEQTGLGDNCLMWLLDCQGKENHPLTRVSSGGWSWTDRSGGVPDVDDTSGALLALVLWRDQTHPRKVSPERSKVLTHAARAGSKWLIDLQNNNGGWPTFCRGWGKLAFDRSGSDLTAHALRALVAWRGHWSAAGHAQGLKPDLKGKTFDQKIARALKRGHQYLLNQQQRDGSWTPLWFGNQYHPQEENPVYGTCRVLLALEDLDQGKSLAACRARQWLVDRQHASGGWGTDPLAGTEPCSEQDCSVEETALTCHALLTSFDRDVPQTGEKSKLRTARDYGLTWLIEAVETGRHRQSSPIGLYFAKLWYDEKLYPLIFTTAALGRAVNFFQDHPERNISPSGVLATRGSPPTANRKGCSF